MTGAFQYVWVWTNGLALKWRMNINRILISQNGGGIYIVFPNHEQVMKRTKRRSQRDLFFFLSGWKIPNCFITKLLALSREPLSELCNKQKALSTLLFKDFCNALELTEEPITLCVAHLWYFFAQYWKVERNLNIANNKNNTEFSYVSFRGGEKNKTNKQKKTPCAPRKGELGLDICITFTVFYSLYEWVYKCGIATL